jgi:aldose 1-epimerase
LIRSIERRLGTVIKVESLSCETVRVDFDAARGGRIAQVVVRDVPLLVDARDADDPVLGWGCYPMVPWAGRLARGRFQFRRDVVRMPINTGMHAIHGTGVFNPWRVIGVSTSSLVARLDLEPTGWPYESWCEQRISLGPDSLHLEISVHGDVREFPAQVGWHPWFRVPDSYVAEFDVMFERDTNHLTTGRRLPATDGPWDDCFTDVRTYPCIVIDGVRIELASSCRYWVVYNESPRGWCIEPQSGPPNAFNVYGESALDVVGPARVLQHSFTWRFTA